MKKIQLFFPSPQDYAASLASFFPGAPLIGFNRSAGFCAQGQFFFKVGEQQVIGQYPQESETIVPVPYDLLKNGKAGGFI